MSWSQLGCVERYLEFLIVSLNPTFKSYYSKVINHINQMHMNRPKSECSKVHNVESNWILKYSNLLQNRW